jgi:hypothetical protein
MNKPDFIRMARDMADDVTTKRPGCGVTALAIMSDALRAAYAAGLERAAEIADDVEDSLSEGISEWAAARKVAAVIRAEKEKTDD